MKTVIAKPLRLALVACALFVTTAAHCEPSKVATELVVLAKFDQAVLIATQMAVRRDVESGRASQATASCFSRQGHASITPLVSAFLTSQLTPSELEAARNFYSSTMGAKFTEQGIVAFHRAYGFSPPGPMPTFSESETKAILAFSHTSGGNKLMRQQILREAASRGEFNAPVQAMLEKCKR